MTRLPPPPDQTDAEAEALELAGFCARCGEKPSIENPDCDHAPLDEEDS